MIWLVLMLLFNPLISQLICLIRAVFDACQGQIFFLDPERIIEQIKGDIGHRGFDCLFA